MAQTVFVLEGIPGITRSVVSTDDSVMRVPDNVKYVEGSAPEPYEPISKTAQKVSIVVEGGDIRFAFGVDPNITTPVGAILKEGNSLELTSAAQIAEFRYTNATAGVNVVLHFYPEFREH